jgi:uncharacterized protein YggE
MVMRVTILSAGLVGAVIATTALGQVGPLDAHGSVSGMGTAELKRAPEFMRLKIVITTKGKDMKEALASLKDRVTAARTQVAALGADKASITTDEPQLATENNDRRRQMEMMMAQRMRGGRRPAGKKEETKPPVSVSTTLSAQWSLKGSTGEQLLVAATALQDKIKAADLAGTKEQSKLSPEEQELADELAGEQAAMFSGDDTPKPGEPIFMFVAPISTAERDALLADGFKKAKERAGQLAKAAGVELGPLRTLNDNEVDASDEMMMNGMYGGGGAAYRMMQMMRGARGPQADLSEAIGIQPNQVVIRVMVTASFDLKAK